jgi:DNA-binding Xre family transcriptional regulator
MSARGANVSYRWHLRMVMAERGMFATSDLVPLLAARGVTLSREQVYRLVAKVPERLSLTTLAALCDILECTPADLIEPVRLSGGRAAAKASKPGPAPPEIHPRRARVGRRQR